LERLIRKAQTTVNIMMLKEFVNKLDLIRNFIKFIDESISVASPRKKNGDTIRQNAIILVEARE
jgi:hypothetical protein